MCRIFSLTSRPPIPPQVTPENGLQEYNSISFGNEFDMSNYNQLVQLANGKYKHLFA